MVRLVGADGEMVGVVPLRQALEAAADADLDLVEVAPQADPPVCKILDYGKFRFEEQKKANEARKKQKIIELKEIKLRPNIDDHDYEVKMRSAIRFIEEGDKVKMTMRFRGREMAHQDLGLNVPAPGHRQGRADAPGRRSYDGHGAGPALSPGQKGTCGAVRRPAPFP